MIDLKLPLFPADGVAASVTVSVWLGVVVVVFFNLRFGWTLSGLVVPGYLVPLLFVKPTSVAIVVAEAIITYAIAKFLSDGVGSRGWRSFPYWCSWFGRDRFFAIVLISILVRAALDGWLLPSFGQYLNHRLGIQIDYRNDLHSYGLIVVALLANYLWKPGLVAGLSTSTITVGITYAILRWGMLNFTNFSLGALSYLYEDVSTSLLSSPKSYILILSTAFVASRMNLRYSWDFHGILVPSLLALLWHEPYKIVVSLVEAAWILQLATWILRLPVWQRMTVEGGRKTLLFFSIAAFHRLLLAHLLPQIGWMHVTDSFGFGYLLTSLMAIKAYDKQVPIRIFRATMETSMVGAVAGSVLGFLLTIVPSLFAMHESSSASSPTATIARDDRRLWEVLNVMRVHWYAKRMPSTYSSVLPQEMHAFRLGVEACRTYVQESKESSLRDASRYLQMANYQITLIQDRYLLIHERPPLRGWGTFVLDRTRPHGMFVEIPATLDEWATLESGLVVFDEMQGGALAIAGTSRDTNQDRGSDTLILRNTMLATFHRVCDAEDTVQIRGYTESLLQSSLRWTSAQAKQGLEGLSTSLWVRGALPRTLRLSQLNQLVQEVDVHWQDVREPNVLRDESHRGFAELLLSIYDRRRLRNRLALPTDVPAGIVKEIHESVETWLRADFQHTARQGSEDYQPALLEELVYLDEEVVQPLIQLASRSSASNDDPRQMEQAAAISAAASALDYELIDLHDPLTKSGYWILAEKLPKQRHWGTYVFRHGLSSPHVVEVPRPLYEQQTYEFGLSEWQRLEGATISIAGAHPFANRDGRADVTQLTNKVNLFQLVRQVVLRELAPRETLVTSCRAIQSPVDADVVMAVDDGTYRRDQLPATIQHVADQLERNGMSLRLADGSEMLAGYELGIMLQLGSLEHVPHARMINLWISPSLRRQFRGASNVVLETDRFAAVGITTTTEDLTQLVGENGVESISPLVPIEFIACVEAYRGNNDILHLDCLRREWPEYQLSRVIDPATDRSFLVIRDARHAVPTLLRLDGPCVEERFDGAAWTHESLRAYIEGSALRFQIGGDR